MKAEGSFLLENAAWPAFAVEPGGTIRLANRAAIQFFGPAIESGGTNLASIWAQEQETVDQFLAHWDRSATPSSTLKFRGKGAVITPFLVHITTTRDSQRRYLFQLLNIPIVIVPPVEAKPNTGDPPQAIKQRLDCALQLTRSVSLDFNNALTSILGHTSFLLDQMPADHPWHTSLVEVEKAAQRAAEIASQLAGLTRPDKLLSDTSATSLNPLLRRIVDGFRRTAPPAISWDAQLEVKPFAARFDEAKIQQVFAKVIENAIEAMAGHGQITLTSYNLNLKTPTYDGTAHLQATPYVCVEVMDTGPGIPPEVLPRVFDPFFTTKPGHRGLGLAWVYGIVTNHGGGVAISNLRNRGTSVRIYLPATDQIARDIDAPETDPGLRLNLLIVDDESLLLTLAQTVLAGRGYHVVTANSGESALELLAKSKQHVDVVIADLVMPGMSGRELVDALREGDPNLRVICSSGYANPGQLRPGELFLEKPYTSQQLLRAVREAWERPNGEVTGGEVISDK